MNKEINKPEAGIIIYQNAGMSDRSYWYFVKPDFLREISKICEKTFFVEGHTDKDSWEEIHALIYNDGKENPNILYEGFTDPWAWHGQRDLPINKYEIIGIIPVKQVW